MLAIVAESKSAKAGCGRALLTVNNHKTIVFAHGRVNQMLAIGAELQAGLGDSLIKLALLAIQDCYPTAAFLLGVPGNIGQMLTIGAEHNASSRNFPVAFAYGAIQNHRGLTPVADNISQVLAIGAEQHVVHTFIFTAGDSIQGNAPFAVF